MKLRLELTTLSDTLIGSARSFGTIIDSDIVFDDIGLPYIPAKRIKGLFRNALVDLFKARGFEALSSSEDEVIKELFGTIGKNEPESSTIFDNLYLADTELMTHWLNYFYENFNVAISKQQVMEYFTQLRSQTAIDSEMGIAKDHSLRTFRVLKKGFTFMGNIEIQDASDEILELLTYASMYIKRVGSMRNRGFGNVKLELYEESGKSLNEDIKTKLEEECKN